MEAAEQKRETKKERRRRKNAEITANESDKVELRERVVQVPRRTLDSWINSIDIDVIVVDDAVVVDPAHCEIVDSADAFDLPLHYYMLPPAVDAVSISGCDLNILSTGSNCTSTRDGPLV